MKRIFSAILLVCLFAGCGEKQSFSFFGTTIEHDNSIEFIGHAKNWLQLSGLDEIYHVKIMVEKSASSAQKSLGGLLPEGYLVNDIVSAFIFSTNTDTSKVEIRLDKVHAMGIVRYQDGKFHLDYLEKSKDQFVLRPELSGNVSAGINVDDLRLFHFASTPSSALPLVSTIFDLNLKILPSKGVQAINRSIGDAFLMNMNLNKGMNTLDIAGELFYAAMKADDNNTGGSFCGGNRNCPLGSARCIEAPGGPAMVCDAPSNGGGGGGCANEVLVHIAQQNVEITQPFDLVNLYEFKDSFLMKYEKGKQFIAYMYLIGRYMKSEKVYMDNYLNLIEVGQEAVMKIQASNENEVIFDEKFTAVFATFIQNHKDVKSRQVDQALSVLESDLAQIKGFTQKQFIQFLSEPLQIQK